MGHPPAKKPANKSAKPPVEAIAEATIMELALIEPEPALRLSAAARKRCFIAIHAWVIPASAGRGGRKSAAGATAAGERGAGLMRCFLKALVVVPLRPGRGVWAGLRQKDWAIGLWVEVTPDDFRACVNHSPRRLPLALFRGVLASRVPGFAGTIGAPMELDPGDGRFVPTARVLLAGRGRPRPGAARLARWQREGRTADAIVRYMTSLRLDR
ncbi:MAG: hypothetical protein LW650_05160 [Planctomycetaceae bacterium]|jgi:hypothetical protein|nr:hypothetical protein [Phycisphaerales bacterium]MCE2652896.1 hypothetical protein [Planctomycetaceae bacterium]